MTTVTDSLLIWQNYYFFFFFFTTLVVAVLLFAQIIISIPTRVKNYENYDGSQQSMQLCQGPTVPFNEVKPNPISS